MGVELLYSTTSEKNGIKFNELLYENEIYKRLSKLPKEITVQGGMCIYTKQIFKIDKVGHPNWDNDLMKILVNNGSIKISAWINQDLSLMYPNIKNVVLKNGMNSLFYLFLEDLTCIYEELSNELNSGSKLGLKFYYGSCAFNILWYFSLEQIQRMTNFGQYISGYSGRDLELYNKIKGL